GIMSDYRKALDDPEAMAIFDRTVRAIANGGSLQPITEVELRRMKQGHDYALSTSPSTAHPRFFGVDCGNACWFWCEEWLAGEKRARLVWAEKINSDRLVERVSELIRLLQPRFGIVDARPLLDAARKIAYLHPDHVALQEFVNGRELTVSLERHTIDEPGSANAEYGPEYRLVQVDRNTSLDQFCAEAKHPDRGLILPNEPSKIMTDVGAHLKKLQKQRTRNAAGNVVDKFVEKVANHLGMAASSARLARLVAPTVLPYIYRPSAHVPRSFGFKGAFV
ncbi:MAG: hypothetical protein JWO56_3604, partial [Acidobacteria bacterium]|nr:hypothetical protein [Acidobacteriota bacterium]